MERWNFWSNIISALFSIEQIIDPTQKEQKKIELRQVLEQEWSKNSEVLLNRFIDIGTDIRVINLSGKLLNLLRESMYCYVNEQYSATIATSGIASEIFCSQIYMEFLEEEGFDEFQVRTKIEIFDKISQVEKVDVLSSVMHIAPDIIGRLTEIRKIRNKNVHPSESISNKNDALICLKNLVTVLHRYSDDIENITQETEGGGSEETEEDEGVEPPIDKSKTEFQSTNTTEETQEQ